MKKLMFLLFIFFACNELARAQINLPDKVEILQKFNLSNVKPPKVKNELIIGKVQASMVEYALLLRRKDTTLWETVVLNSKTKQIEQIAIADFRKQDIPNPSTCEEQEQQQWDDFNRNVYPSLKAAANRKCSPVFYCITIFCNNEARVSYAFLIKPDCVKEKAEPLPGIE